MSRRGRKRGPAVVSGRQSPAHLPPAGYVLADALARSLPVPVALGVLAALRNAEPAPGEARDAHAALIGSGFLLPSGTLTAQGREAARAALASLASLADGWGVR